MTIHLKVRSWQIRVRRRSSVYAILLWTAPVLLPGAAGCSHESASGGGPDVPPKKFPDAARLNSAPPDRVGLSAAVMAKSSHPAVPPKPQ